MDLESLDFTTLALLSATLTALLTFYLGLLVLLRRLVFVGVTLSQLATAGIALSGLCHLPCQVGGILMMFLGVSCLAWESPHSKLPPEGAIGSWYVGAGALAVLGLALAPHSDSDLQGLLFGNILAVTNFDIYLMLGTLLVLALLNFFFYKEFWLTAFDPLMAQALGYKVRFWNWLFYLTVGLAIAVAIHSAGALLVFALLIVPPLIGLTLSRRWWRCVVYSLLSSLVSVGAGLALSLHWDLPSGATIVALACVLLILTRLGRYLFPAS